MNPDATHEVFAVCLPGLEPWLIDELGAVGIAKATAGAGGVSWSGDLESVYRANLESGLATHVLVRVAEFGARSLADLDHRGARIDWSQWLPPGARVRVKANCKRSRIYHSGAAEQRIQRHLTDSLGAAEQDDSTDDPADHPITVRVRIHDNRCRISIDTSGVPLHRRGWRHDPRRAPLREDLAHALVLASGWDRESPLVDPMTGSGTIVIEAAALARGLAPGRLRTFAHQSFANHDTDLWQRVQREALARTTPRLPFRLAGSDRDGPSIDAAIANAERAGVAADIDWRVAGLSECDPTSLGPHGTLVTNPPYGKRLGDTKQLTDLYRTLGRVFTARPEAWRVAIAAADRRLALKTGIELETAFLVDSGGLKIRALTAAGTAPRSSAP